MAKRRVRRYGTGAVQQLPSGSWRARIRAAGQTIGRTFPTREKAEDWLRQSAPGKVAADVFGMPDRGEKPDATFAEAGELLPAAWAARGRTADSIRGYRSHLAAALEEWGPRRIADTRPANLHVWIAGQQKSGRAPRTILQRLVMLSQAMKAAVDAGWLPAVPCTVPRPRVVAKSERTCTPEPVFEKLLKAATKSKDPRHLALLLLAADAGLRRGEIGRVLGRHVRLGGDGVASWGTVHVAVISETSRTKSGKGRTVPILTERLADALKAVFPAPDAPVLRVRTHRARDLADDLWALAKLGPGSRLHELRHRWVTRLLDAGVPPALVMAWAGHADLTTTLRYHHGVPDAPAGAGMALLGEKRATNVPRTKLSR